MKSSIILILLFFGVIALESSSTPCPEFEHLLTQRSGTARIDASKNWGNNMFCRYKFDVDLAEGEVMNFKVFSYTPSGDGVVIASNGLPLTAGVDEESFGFAEINCASNCEIWWTTDNYNSFADEWYDGYDDPYPAPVIFWDTVEGEPTSMLELLQLAFAMSFDLPYAAGTMIVNGNLLFVHSYCSLYVGELEGLIGVVEISGKDLIPLWGQVGIYERYVDGSPLSVGSFPSGAIDAGQSLVIPYDAYMYDDDIGDDIRYSNFLVKCDWRNGCPEGFFLADTDLLNFTETLDIGWAEISISFLDPTVYARRFGDVAAVYLVDNDLSYSLVMWITPDVPLVGRLEDYPLIVNGSANDDDFGYLSPRTFPDQPLVEPASSGIFPLTTDYRNGPWLVMSSYGMYDSDTGCQGSVLFCPTIDQCGGHVATDPELNYVYNRLGYGNFDYAVLAMLSETEFVISVPYCNGFFYGDIEEGFFGGGQVELNETKMVVVSEDGYFGETLTVLPGGEFVVSGNYYSLYCTPTTCRDFGDIAVADNKLISPDAGLDLIGVAPLKTGGVLIAYEDSATPENSQVIFCANAAACTGKAFADITPKLTGITAFIIPYSLPLYATLDYFPLYDRDLKAVFWCDVHNLATACNGAYDLGLPKWQEKSLYTTSTDDSILYLDIAEVDGAPVVLISAPLSNGNRGAFIWCKDPLTQCVGDNLFNLHEANFLYGNFPGDRIGFFIDQETVSPAPLIIRHPVDSSKAVIYAPFAQNADGILVGAFVYCDTYPECGGNITGDRTLYGTAENVLNYPYYDEFDLLQPFDGTQVITKDFFAVLVGEFGGGAPLANDADPATPGIFASYWDKPAELVNGGNFIEPIIHLEAEGEFMEFPSPFPRLRIFADSVFLVDRMVGVGFQRSLKGYKCSVDAVSGAHPTLTASCSNGTHSLALTHETFVSFYDMEDNLLHKDVFDLDTEIDVSAFILPGHKYRVEVSSRPIAGPLADHWGYGTAEIFYDIPSSVVLSDAPATLYIYQDSAIFYMDALNAENVSLPCALYEYTGSIEMACLCDPAVNVTSFACHFVNVSAEHEGALTIEVLFENATLGSMDVRVEWMYTPPAAAVVVGAVLGTVLGVLLIAAVAVIVILLIFLMRKKDAEKKPETKELNTIEPAQPIVVVDAAPMVEVASVPAAPEPLAPVAPMMDGSMGVVVDVPPPEPMPAAPEIGVSITIDAN